MTGGGNGLGKEKLRVLGRLPGIHSKPRRGK